MSTPVATASELGVYMGATIDLDRGSLMLRLAQALCESIANPLPDGAEAVVLPVAARAYTNVASASQIGMGSAYASLSPTGQGGVGGLYLSRRDEATLRRLKGRSGAFSIDMLPRGASEVQAVIVEATAGTYTLSFDGQESTALAFDATAATVQTALEALSSIGSGAVLVEAGFILTFKGDLANTAVPLIVADDTDLTGTVTVISVVQGARPAWDA